MKLLKFIFIKKKNIFYTRNFCFKDGGVIYFKIFTKVV